MAVAALIISVLALMAAGASAWFTRRQASAAHEQLLPRLVVRTDGSLLTVENVGHRDARDVSIRETGDQRTVIDLCVIGEQVRRVPVMAAGQTETFQFEPCNGDEGMALEVTWSDGKRTRTLSQPL